MCVFHRAAFDKFALLLLKDELCGSHPVEMCHACVYKARVGKHVSLAKKHL